MLNWRNLMEEEETTEKEHWCFVSYQYTLKNDSTPRFGNITLPMTGRITNNDSFQVLNQFITRAITVDDPPKIAGRYTNIVKGFE